MGKLIKYGGYRRRLMKRVSEEPNLKASMNVPNKFLETEGRKKFQRIISTLGVITFGITALIVGIMLLFMAAPSLLPESLSELRASFVVIPLFLINLMGMFINSASDGVGANWFARGILMMASLLVIGVILADIFVK